MTPWQQKFEAQNVVGKTAGAIASLKTVTVETLDEAGLGQFSRLQKGLVFVRGRLKGIDPELVSQNLLTNLGGWVTNIATHIQSFTNSQNAAHLVNANATLDSIIDAVRTFSVAAKTDEHAMGNADAAFRDKAIEAIERVRESRKEAITDLATLKREITQAKTTLEETNRIIESQKSRLDQSIAEFQKQFSTAEAKRTSDFQNAMGKVSDDASDEIETFKVQFENERDERRKQLETIDKENAAHDKRHFEFLEERQKQVNEIFEAIGSASLAGHFRKTADEQRNAANRYRWLALTLMLFMVAVAGITFYQTLRAQTVDWHLFVFRFGTSVILIVPALYAAQESAKHRERERRLRKSHLELASIDAYLALLPQDKRNELKEKLTEKFFGQSEVVEKDETVTGHSLLKLLEIVLKNLTKGT